MDLALLSLLTISQVIPFFFLLLCQALPCPMLLLVLDQKSLQGIIDIVSPPLLITDFLTGIYHWGVDNYGDGETPVVGSQIAAFQGHHQRPWTITEREFCNNLHKVIASCFLHLPRLQNQGSALKMNESKTSTTMLEVALISSKT